MKGADRYPYRRAVTNSYFEKAFLINFIDTYSKLLKHLIYVRFLLIEGYEQDALQGASFVEQHKAATLRKSSG